MSGCACHILIKGSLYKMFNIDFTLQKYMHPCVNLFFTQGKSIAKLRAF